MNLPHDPTHTSSTWSHRPNESLSPPQRSTRLQIAHAKWVLRHLYERPFDESKHPRAPRGRPEGGQWVPKNGTQAAAPPGQPNQPEPKPPGLTLDERTTTELKRYLTFHTSKALTAQTEEERALAIRRCDRLQKALEARQYSDEHAPLAAKERLWKAQREYQEFYSYRLKLERLLAKPPYQMSSATRDRFKDHLVRIDAQMKRLAAITGSTLPRDNPIATWTFEQKLSAVMQRVQKSGRLKDEFVAQLAALLEPANLARMAAMMAAVALAHAFPIAGLAADVTILALVGTETLLIAYRLYLEIDAVHDEADLDGAARVLEQELARQGAGKLMQLLTWGAGKGAAAFNKRYKITLDRQMVRKVGRGEMVLTPNPRVLLPIKIQKRVVAKPAPKKPAAISSTSRKWIPPKGWNGPSAKYGKWQGRRGDSGWLDNRPGVKRITKGKAVRFVKGDVVFKPWVKVEFRVRGVKGGNANRSKDTRLIYEKIFQREKLGKTGEVFVYSKHRKKVTDWLKRQPDGYGGKGIRPHHAGGDKIQYVPIDLHVIQHTNTKAFVPRTNVGPKARPKSAAKTQATRTKPGKRGGR